MDGLGFSPAQREVATGPLGDAVDGRADRVVRLVQSEIIPRLLSARRAGERRIGSSHVETLARLSLSRDPAAAQSQVAALREAGAPVEALLNDLIGPAALRLGDYWTTDIADFVDVAVAVGRLCAAVRALGAHIDPPVGAAAPGALLATLEPERHGLGALIAAQTLRLAGWRVREAPGVEPHALMALARAGRWRLIGVSLGGVCDEAATRVLLARLRAVSGRRGVAIAVGGPACQHDPDLAARLGADFQAADAREAAALARAHLSEGVQAVNKA